MLYLLLLQVLFIPEGLCLSCPELISWLILLSTSPLFVYAINIESTITRNSATHSSSDRASTSYVFVLLPIYFFFLLVAYILLRAVSVSFSIVSFSFCFKFVEFGLSSARDLRNIYFLVFSTISKRKALVNHLRGIDSQKRGNNHREVLKD
jgi:hypothetical protein